MEIILVQDVKGTGKKGDQVNVKDGYARHLHSKVPRKQESLTLA